MLKINTEVIKRQENFWNHCLFHPTDAVEDAWGKRILDRLSADGSIQTVRIYTMFEDIVLKDENGKLTYDFRVNDLRLDYLVEKGLDLMLAYAGIPDCIALNNQTRTSVSKNKTRYKGKLFNTSAPEDYALWEEICYEYTKHIIERYGIETVSKWHLHCFNEPDIAAFFLADLPEDEACTKIRVQEYCKLYHAFEKGIRKASDKLCIGGPALAWHLDFLGDFLDYVKEHRLQLDYIPLHNYGTSPDRLNDGSRPFCVGNNVEKQRKLMQTIREHGFGDTEIVLDEWGAATAGFFNKEEAPLLMFRETEKFASYYVKLIAAFIKENFPVSKMLICLSGQHEMIEDFSGFRNFFTMNFIAKPIYNAHIMASKLGESLLQVDCDTENVCVIPTRIADGDYAVLLTYSSDTFEEDLPAIEETVEFAEDITGKKVTVYGIDKKTTNPYRLSERKGMTNPSQEEIKELREEGRLKPIADYIHDGTKALTLSMTANATFLITVTAQ